MMLRQSILPVFIQLTEHAYDTEVNHVLWRYDVFHDDLWMDCLRVKELDGGITSINALVNEGLKMVRDRKMQEITAQRKRRNTLQSMTAS